MNREYHKNRSKSLGRQMEMLVFGHAGLPVLAFSTSSGRFFDFENRGMIAALAEKIEAGQLQLFCVDSVDAESWYNRQISPRRRVARQLEYERYILEEAIPAVRARSDNGALLAFGCSLGGYHAVNLALRHPSVFTGFLALSGAFDLTQFLDGYYDDDCYFNLPLHYMANLTDPTYLDRYRENNKYVFATGWDDRCLKQNQDLAAIFADKEIPHQLHIWNVKCSHDWPVWQQMAKQYL